MKRLIDLIVVHCADTPANMQAGAKDIDQWHKERGWSGIGYHYVIQRSGLVELGRPLETPGAHVSGHNANSIGICMIGGKGNTHAFDGFTDEQQVSLSAILITLMGLYPKADICGHRDLDPSKLCPTFDVRPQVDHLRQIATAWRGSIKS